MKRNLIALGVFLLILVAMGWAQTDDYETSRRSHGYYLVFAE